jgi:LPS-assembly protein
MGMLWRCRAMIESQILTFACRTLRRGAGSGRMRHHKKDKRKGRIGLAAMLALAGTGAVAETLPPLRIDPALLGAPTPPQRESSGAQAPQKLFAAAAAAAAPPATQSSASLAQPATPANAATVAAKPLAKVIAATSAATPEVDTSVGTAAPAAAVAAVVKEEPAPAAQFQPHQPPSVKDGDAVAPHYSDDAAAGRLPDPKLKVSTVLTPLSANSADAHPVYIFAGNLHGVNDKELVAEGGVQLRQLGTVLDADKLTYWQDQDVAEAIGNVRLSRDLDLMTGPKLRLKLKDNVGFFDSPRYAIKRTRILTEEPGQVQAGLVGLPTLTGPMLSSTTASGEAERIDFEGKNHYTLTNATYSTCPAGNNDWFAKLGELKLDYDREIGDARNVIVEFRGVPFFYMPYTTFSLNNQRKSGFLTPTIGSTSMSGLEVTTPYYFNIAPNMDATLAPRLLSKRGVQWNGEFRYLEPNYSGISRVEYLPNDRSTGDRRYSYAVAHSQNFGGGFGASLNLNGVSDDTYFSDLSTRIANTSQGNQLRQGTLTYGAGWWNAAAMVQHYQTLQDPALGPVAIPYRRLPQLTLNALRPDMPYGSTFVFNSEYVDFSHPTLDTGRRTTLYPQFSLLLQYPAFYLTPKLGLNLTRYSLERHGSSGPDSISRNVPIFSVDSGVTFERDTAWFGQQVTQTLEPRLYYLFVPNHEQSQIPVFDTGIADFSFAQIFSENRYSGGDRIADANQLTAAVTSRLIDPNSGAELLRGAIGQRFYFTTQQVTLNYNNLAQFAETPRTGRSTDFLLTLSGQILAKTYFDAGWQYNQNEHVTEKLNLGGRYQPELGKVLNAGYRYTRDQLGQVDVSAQWPLLRGWQGVARYNYSTKDHRLIESLAGMEYDGGCWAARLVVQRIATATQAANTAIFVQLELNDFSRIGSNPLEILKRNIPGYGRINQPTADPAFGAE